MNRNLVFICLLFLSAQLWAQQNQFKKINGVLSASSGDLSGIHIINITSGLATISSEEGSFSIGAKLNDTIRISAIGYQPKLLVLDQQKFNQFSLVVELDTEVIALNEVVLMPFNLSGDLAIDMGVLRVEDQVSEFSLGLPNATVKPLRKSQRLLHEATTGGGILPINPILNGISGRTKKLKKLVDLDLKNQQTLRTRYYFPDSLFVKYLKIDQDKILDFMFYCETDAEFTYYSRINDKFKLWELMRIKSIDYREQNKLN